MHKNIITTTFTFCMLAFSGCGKLPVEYKHGELKSMVLHNIPSGDLVKQAYDAILKTAVISDPEMVEFCVFFSKSNISTDDDDASVSVQMVSKTDKNKVIEYSYSFSEARVSGPKEVTLSAGTGPDEKFMDKYEDFSPWLFRSSEIILFDKLDAIYNEVVEKSTYKPEECYIKSIIIKNYGDKMENHITVQSTRSSTASKYFYFDTKGKMETLL